MSKPKIKHKFCSRCGSTKLRKRTLGKLPICKKCCREVVREWYYDDTNHEYKLIYQQKYAKFGPGKGKWLEELKAKYKQGEGNSVTGVK